MAFVCLMYHSLSDGRFPDSSYLKYTTTRRTFSEHFRHLKEHGYAIISVSRLLEQLASGRQPDEKTCVFTFDDGHKSSIEMAEILANSGAGGTFYLTKSYCEEREDFLKENEIRSLAQQGFDFGTHGVTHRSLAHMPREEMQDEVRQSKEWLENVLGKPVRSMSLPAGQGDSEVYRTAYALGYSVVGNSREATNTLDSLPAAMNRFVILSHHDATAAGKIASGSLTYIWGRRVRSALLYVPKRILQPYNKTRDSGPAVK